jgi:hypothetical protein
MFIFAERMRLLSLSHILPALSLQHILILIFIFLPIVPESPPLSVNLLSPLPDASSYSAKLQTLAIIVLVRIPSALTFPLSFLLFVVLLTFTIL